jgi:hypothetical protein
LENFEKFGFSALLAALLVAAALAYPAFRFLLLILVKQYNQFAKGPSAQHANPSADPSRPGKEYARKTDIYEKLSAQQKEMHNQAVACEAAGEITKAAALFEQISFQRRAIDILENAKLIDEACAVLIRMNAIHRAGVVYERHGMLTKAAPMYFQAKMPDKSAEVYLRLGREDFRYYSAAEKDFGLANDHKQQIYCLILLGQVTRAVEMCRELKRFDLLATHLDNHILFSIAANAITVSEWDSILLSMTASPICMLRFATWLEFAPNKCLPMEGVLKKVAQEQDLSLFFWEIVSRRCKAEKMVRQMWSAAAVEKVKDDAKEIANKPQMGEIFAFLSALVKLLEPQKSVTDLGATGKKDGNALQSDHSEEELVIVDLSS